MFNANLKRGSIELLVLAVLEGHTRHGYDIGKHLERLSDGKLQFRVSTLYTVLYRMEGSGWIKGRWVEKKGQRRRCYYSLTSEGQRVLVRQRHEWVSFSAVVNQVVGVGHA